MRGSACLVTGGAGFIGSHLAADLVRRGAEVTVLDNLSTGQRSYLPEGASLREGDVRDPEAVARAVRGQEYVFHLAAEVGNVLSVEDPMKNMEINVGGAIRVFEAARRAGAARVVYASSSACLGEARRVPQAEDHPCAPISPYGASKYAAELYGLALHAVHGLPFVATRFFNVYGPRQGSTEYGNVIPIFFRRIREGQPLRIFGDGRQTRDFTFVEDVVRALVLAAERPGADGQVFHVGTGRATSVLRLARTMRTVMGRDTGTYHEAARKGEVRRSVADIRKARRILGFVPQVDLESGLRATLASFESAPRAATRPG